MASATTETIAAGAEPPKLKLYSYWRSSCAHRVRIALKLKGVEYEYKAVNLLKGEQHSPEYENVNPVKFVPALVDGDFVLSDSFAIILYLEEKYSQHPLLPHDLCKKALNYQVASIVGSSIQPLQNLAVLKLIQDEKQRAEWPRQHVSNGFRALEKLLKGQEGKYATADEVLLADVFLAPQLHAGINRFNVDMTPFPTLAKLHEAYLEHPAFQAALPHVQPDAPSGQ